MPLRFLKNFLRKKLCNAIQPAFAHLKEEFEAIKAENERQWAFFHFLENQKKKAIPPQESAFALFDFSLSGNLGDEIQSFATQKALEKICPKAQFSFVPRDTLNFAGGGGKLCLCKAGFRIFPIFCRPRI